MGKFNLFAHGDGGRQELITVCRDNVSHRIAWINECGSIKFIDQGWRKQDEQAIMVRKKGAQPMRGWQMAGILDQLERLDQIELRDPWTYKRYRFTGTYEIKMGDPKMILFETSDVGNYTFDHRTGKIELVDVGLKTIEQRDPIDERSW